MNTKKLESFYSRIDNVDTGARDIRFYEISAIKERKTDTSDHVFDAFRLGFAKGQAAEKAKEKTLCKEDSFKGLKARTIQGIRKLKMVYSVEAINILVDLLNRGDGPGTWSDSDVELYLLVTNALELHRDNKTKGLHVLNVMAHAFNDKA